MKKYTNLKLNEILLVFNSVVATVHFKDVKTTLYIRKKRAEMINLLQPFDEVKNELIAKHGKNGVLDSNNLKPDVQELVAKQMNDLASVEVDFEFGKKIKLSEFVGVNKTPSAIELDALEDIIEVDVDIEE